MELKLHAIPFEKTQYGFKYGDADVTRVCSDDRKGWVVIGIASRRSSAYIRVTKTGKMDIQISENVGVCREEEPCE